MNKSEIVRTLIDTCNEKGLVPTLYGVFGKNVKVTVGFAGSACNTGIENLDLSVRSYNALRRAGINTLGELIDRMNQGELKCIRNLGAKSYSEIQTKMLVYGFETLSEGEKKAFFYDLVENNKTK